MPVYEFYCPGCHTVFSFISRRINTDKRPRCPRCEWPELERQVSRFAISRGLDEQGEEAFPGLDETRMEQAMTALASDMEQVNEEDPRAVAHLMRRFSDLAGMRLGEGVEDALQRLEAGEDPEKIEEEMGELFEGESPFAKEDLQKLRRRAAPPQRDETLYRLD